MADNNYVYDPVSTGEPVRQQPYRMEAGQLWRQFAFAGIANIATVFGGFALGWTSPVNMKLNSTDESPLDDVITSDQVSWVGSLVNIGAIMGPFLGGFVATNIGRKWGLMTSVIPQLLGFILVTTARNIGMIYAGRIIWGLAVGMLFTIVPMYCAEIATDDSRGALGSLLQLFITLGFLLVYSVGPYVSYSVLQYVGMAVVVAFAVLFFFAPETPIYHLYKENTESAAECLSIIRGKSRSGVQAELDKMSADVKASLDRTASFMDIFRGNNFKAFYLSCVLLMAQQFCGINAVLFYMATIFSASGASLDAAIATIIVGAVQVFASSITPLVVDRLGRRILLLISCCGTAVGNGLLGMYFILDSNGSPVVESIQFLPILSLVLYILTYCWGLGPLPWAVLSELMPIEVKAVASPIATAYCWTISFLVTRYFNPIADAIGMGVTFLIFGACCVLSFFFTLFMVPETKGKSFQEIQEMLAGKTEKEKLEMN